MTIQKTSKGYKALHKTPTGKIYEDTSPTRIMAIETILMYIAQDIGDQKFISKWYEDNIPY